MRINRATRAQAEHEASTTRPGDSMHLHAAGRHLIRALAALALAVGAAAAPALAADDMVFAVAKLPLSLPIYVAQAQGYFSDEKLALRIHDCDIGRTCLDRLTEGQVQLATSADTPIVFASLKGHRFGVLATIATTRNNIKIIARRGRGIATAADLPGKRVGTLVGTTAQYFLDLSLLSAGVEPGRVAIVPVTSAQVVQALADDRLDAISVFEPFAFQAARALGDQALVLANKRLRIETWNVVVSDSIAGTRDAELQALCRALDRAVGFIERHPAAARAILRDRLGLDEAAVDWIWSDTDYVVGLRQSLITGLEAQTRWALRNGHATGTPPNYLSYIRSGPLARVRPGAVSIVQ
jgi:NitT/TauT family transport system substrate-binding protein